MTFLWGGSKSLNELAVKFGWPSVIISIILTPFLLLWKNLLAYPFWLYNGETNGENGCKTHDDVEIVNFTLHYPGHNNQWRKQLYEAETNPGRPFVGWNVLADVEGGKFIESFFGVIQVLDLEEKGDKWILKENSLSWFPADVLIHFEKEDEHEVTIDIPVGGLNMYNPFFLMTKAFVLLSLSVAKYWGYVPLKRKLGVKDEMSQWLEKIRFTFFQFIFESQFFSIYSRRLFSYRYTAVYYDPLNKRTQLCQTNSVRAKSVSLSDSCSATYGSAGSNQKQNTRRGVSVSRRMTRGRG